MTAKTYLLQIVDAERKIRRLQWQKDDLRATLYSFGLSSPGDSGDRVQTSPDPDRLIALISKIDSKERRISREIDALVDLKYRIAGEIKQLDNPAHADVLYLRYVDLQNGRQRTWEDIAEMMGYAVRYTQTIHGQALREFYLRFKDSME